jgi:hypothetical protein
MGVHEQVKYKHNMFSITILYIKNSIKLDFTYINQVLNIGNNCQNVSFTLCVFWIRKTALMLAPHFGQSNHK